MFPDARFIFIYRNPYKVFNSTKKLFRKFIIEHMGFHYISDQDLEELIIKVAKIGFSEYFKKRKQIPEEKLIEIKFEDFTKDPMTHIEEIYNQLKLGGFEDAKKYIVKFCKSYENYQADQYEMGECLKEKLFREWKFIFNEFGYEK